MDEKDDIDLLMEELGLDSEKPEQPKKTVRPGTKTVKKKVRRTAEEASAEMKASSKSKAPAEMKASSKSIPPAESKVLAESTAAAVVGETGIEPVKKKSGPGKSTHTGSTHSRNGTGKSSSGKSSSGKSSSSKSSFSKSSSGKSSSGKSHSSGKGSSSGSKMKKKRKKKRNNMLILVIMLAALAVFLVSAVMLLKIYLEYHAGTASYDNVADQYVSEEGGQDVVAGGNSDNQDVVTVHLPMIDISALKSSYPNAVGWLYIPDTNINYPIMQATDNEYYLTHMTDGTTNSSGSIFMEMTNSPGYTDQNTVIYGHNMKNGSMFGQLKKYNKQDFYTQHPCFYIYTEAGIQEYKIFAVHVVDAVSSYYVTNFSSTTDYQSYLDQSHQYSMYDTGVVPTTADTVVTLSTCTSSDTQRLIVQGVKGQLLSNSATGTAVQTASIK